MAAFSFDDRTVAVDHPQGGVQLRETATYRELVTLVPPARINVSAVQWSPGGDRVYILGNGHRLYCWDLAALRRELAARGLDW